MKNNKQLIALSLCVSMGVAHAGEKEELLKLRNTTTNLIQQLVKQGILSDKLANDMIKQAEADAEIQAKQQAAATEADKPEAGEVRVPYVPEFVKDSIRDQVRAELRKDVVSDVMQKAKTEKWGLPGALPEWTNRFKLSGDIRLRSENNFMAEGNTPFQQFYVNEQAVNEARGFTAAGQRAFRNTEMDRHQFRERFRLGIDAKIDDGISAGIRLATSNLRDPISTNQTLGNTGGQYQFNIDRAYLKYDAVDDNGFKWLTLTGGRIKNPWYVGGGEFTAGSELVWDVDVSFEGFAGTFKHRINTSTGLQDVNDKGPLIFATAGVFPLQEFEFSGNDKWLFGGQMGLDWGFQNQDNLKFAVAYYDYDNIEAVPNTSNSGTCDLNTEDNEASVPQFMQGGNTLATICREGTQTAPGSLPGLVGLASDYNIINVNASYDIAAFAPIHVRFSGDYAKNIGFNGVNVNRLAGFNVEEETTGWQARVDVGWPQVDKAGHWNTFAAYKYVERDAVLDAFTDSDFHLGGTNAKGWFIGGNYGLMNGVWLTGRWLSADIISGPPYGIDVLQVDINTRF